MKIWYALIQGRRTALGEQSWKITFLASTPSPMLSSTLLEDQMIAVAGLIEDIRNVRITHSVFPHLQTVYRARAQAILHQLYSWRWTWEAQNANAVQAEPALSTNVFATVFSWTHSHLMYEIWLYDALLILLLKFINPPHMDDLHTNQGPQKESLLRPDQVSSVQQPAIEICRSLNYQINNFATPAPIHQWAFPSALAYITLTAESPVTIWVKSTMDSAPERMRVPWFLYVKRLQSQYPNSSWTMQLEPRLQLDTSNTQSSRLSS